MKGKGKCRRRQTLRGGDKVVERVRGCFQESEIRQHCTLRAAGEPHSSVAKLDQRAGSLLKDVTVLCPRGHWEPESRSSNPS